MLQNWHFRAGAEIEARRWLKGGSGFFDHEAVDGDVEGDA